MNAKQFRWLLSVFRSRWRERLRYAWMSPRVYANWWAMPLPKLGIDTVLHLRDGARYHVRGGTTDLSVINEQAISNPYLGSGFVTLAPNSIVVDVGANIGDFTIMAARRCPAGRVLAVEPLGTTGAIIESQARLNGLTNITWVRAVLSGTNGTSAANPVGSPYDTPAAAAEQVDMRTLAQLMLDHGLDHIDLLKLDCEGAEWDILPAAEGALSNVRQIAMEFHCARGWTGEKLGNWLKTQGFEVVHTDGSWTGLLWARRQVL
jgi:FkbM family methyltransferase